MPKGATIQDARCAIDPDLITPKEAAALLGIKVSTLRVTVARKLLHTVPHPTHGSRVLLSRREVLARQKMLEGHPVGMPPRRKPAPPPEAADPLASKDVWMYIAGGAVALGALYVAVKSEDPSTRALAVAALAALAMLAIAQLEQARIINAFERRQFDLRIERLEALSDVDALERIIAESERRMAGGQDPAPIDHASQA